MVSEMPRARVRFQGEGSGVIFRVKLEAKQVKVERR